MKVVINASSLASPLTGIGRYTYNLAYELIKSNDIELSLFNGRQLTDVLPPLLEYKDQKYKTLLKSLIRDNVPYSHQILRLSREHFFKKSTKESSFNIYHDPNYLCYKSDIPTITSVHDLSWIKYPELHPPARVNAMNNYFEKSLASSVHIITDSEFIKSELESIYNYPKKNISTIMLGVDNNFRPRDEKDCLSVLRNIGINYKKFILSVGTIEPRKNIKSVLSTYCLLPLSIQEEYPLVIIGMKGWLEKENIRSIRKLATSKKIIFLDYIDDTKLAILFSSARLLFYPSLYEGFGLPVLEAMASGTSVITSNVSAIPEVIGRDSILHDPLDVDQFSHSIQRIILDTEYRKKYEEKLISRSKEFSWKKCSAQTINLYSKF